MPALNERFEKWKSRKWHQKAGDIFFWLLLILLIIPGPRKFIATNVNKVMLNLRNPGMIKEDRQVRLSEKDYQWPVADEQGSFVSPETLQGEVIFLNFWATWCPPCIAEMPEIQELYDAYGDRVKFMLVTNESPSKVQQFLSARDYDLPIHYGGNPMPSALKVNSYPTTYIISADGRIVSMKKGAANWNSRATRRMLDKLLEEAEKIQRRSI
jgi:thiol-disulfide isomerase/thioredoxin